MSKRSERTKEWPSTVRVYSLIIPLTCRLAELRPPSEPPPKPEEPLGEETPSPPPPNSLCICGVEGRGVEEGSKYPMLERTPEEELMELPLGPFMPLPLPPRPPLPPTLEEELVGPELEETPVLRRI